MKIKQFMWVCVACALVLAVEVSCTGETEARGTPIYWQDEANPEGPWYSPQFLEENPQYASDYLCSNYYKHQYVMKPKEELQTLLGSHDFFLTKHTVPIVCGSKDGQCGITECDCVCHK